MSKGLSANDCLFFIPCHILQLDSTSNHQMGGQYVFFDVVATEYSGRQDDYRAVFIMNVSKFERLFKSSKKYFSVDFLQQASFIVLLCSGKANGNLFSPFNVLKVIHWLLLFTGIYLT